MDTPHSPKFLHCWNLTIRLFSVIYQDTHWGWSYPSAEKQSVYSTAPADSTKSFGAKVSLNTNPEYHPSSILQYHQTLLVFCDIAEMPHKNVIKVKLATIVEGDQKAPFSMATTRGVGESATPFPELLHFTLDTYLYIAEC